MIIKEGYKSFPSGHTSCINNLDLLFFSLSLIYILWNKEHIYLIKKNAGSFAGLGFLSWYLCGKLRAFDNKGHAANLCIVVSPYLFAALVGVSRVDDYWHHWTDVFTGAIIGNLHIVVGFILLFMKRILDLNCFFFGTPRNIRV